MKDNYDLSKMKSRANPYAARLKRQVTIRLNPLALEYFRELASQTGMKYQSLIDLYLTDCAMKHRRPQIIWSSAGQAQARAVKRNATNREQAAPATLAHAVAEP